GTGSGVSEIHHCQVGRTQAEKVAVRGASVEVALRIGGPGINPVVNLAPRYSRQPDLQALELPGLGTEPVESSALAAGKDISVLIQRERAADSLFVFELLAWDEVGRDAPVCPHDARLDLVTKEFSVRISQAIDHAARPVDRDGVNPLTFLRNAEVNGGGRLIASNPPSWRRLRR